MTRNIYLGGNIFRPIGAPDLAEFERRAGELWAEVQGTDFPVRSKLLAREIERTKPDVIGMQEVADLAARPRWAEGRRRPRRPTQVVYDFLATLRRDLKRLGLKLQRRLASSRRPTSRRRSTPATTSGSRCST